MIWFFNSGHIVDFNTKSLIPIINDIGFTSANEHS